MTTDSRTVLVTGAAGYIGSHAALDLLRSGHDVISVDSYVRGHEAALEALQPIADDRGRRLVRARADILDTDAIERAIIDHGVDSVMHFAALAQVAESVTEPLKYWRNNVGGTVSLLEAIDRTRESRSARIDRIVLSSTCATYGEPDTVPIDEDTAQRPVNPYGSSKLAMEHAVSEYIAARAGDVGATLLRYFNVAGCDPDGIVGEDSVPPTRVVPILMEVALGKRAGFTIFGEDYPTHDGTAVRDYVHVSDLARAHTSALDAVRPGACKRFNVGTGAGFSVRELVEVARSVTGVDFECGSGPRRAGDPPELVARADRIRAALGWEPEYVTPASIIETAWAWFKDNPDGYAVKGALSDGDRGGTQGAVQA